MAVSKRIPATENGPAVECTTKSGDVYIVTQNRIAQKFTLWKKVTGGYEKKDVGMSPIELYDKIPWDNQKKK